MAKRQVTKRVRKTAAVKRPRKAAGKRAANGKRTAAARRPAAKRKTATAKPASRARSTEPRKPSRLAAAATIVRGVAAGAAAAVAALMPSARNENDPILMLEADHRRFEEILKQGEETTGRAVKTRTGLLKQLMAALKVHELLEEKILYPALKPHAESHDIVLEGYQEHHVADVLAAELQSLSRTDERWGAKFKVLKESLEHHIEEEEGKMFRIARAVLGRDELTALGARMAALRAEAER
jgi:hypothetical protein